MFTGDLCLNASDSTCLNFVSEMDDTMESLEKLAVLAEQSGLKGYGGHGTVGIPPHKIREAETAFRRQGR